MLLRDVRTQAQLSVEDVHELLKGSGQLEGQLPARSTLYRKLRGFGLQSERRLVEAVIRVCVPDEQHADAVRERAVALLHQAWSNDAKPASPKPQATTRDDDLAAELIRTQRELINVQAQLAAALHGAAKTEKEAARSRALVTTLLILQAVQANTAKDALAPVPGIRSAGTSRPKSSEWGSRLAAVEAERDEAWRAARDAQRRLAEAESLLAAHAMGSPESADVTSPLTRAQEWPTTRGDAAERTASADAAAHAPDRTVPKAADASALWGVRQSAGVSLHPQLREGVRTLKQDPALTEVLGEMLRLDPEGSRMRSVIDGAAQHLLDPAHTGRYLWSQLTRAEKTSFATTVTHLVQREFALADGQHFDYAVAGHEVDLKFTRGNNWMFPPELQGGLCLVVRADDVSGLWSLGLLRVSSDLMRGANRDGKRALSAQGRAAIHWIHRDLPLPQHALRRLPADAVDAIFAQRWGQSRTDELFLRAERTPITKMDLAAVTMQTDSAKRARQARHSLARKGVLLLHASSSRDAERASILGLPTLEPNTWMSVRLTPATPQDENSPTITLDGIPWRVADPSDPETPLPPTHLT
ncbi:NaeI family type II restriction endonuclease [Streptomyces puniciscabiei]